MCVVAAEKINLKDDTPLGIAIWSKDIFSTEHLPISEPLNFMLLRNVIHLI